MVRVIIHRQRRLRRGVAALISLVFIALLSVLALGIYSSSNLSIQVVANEKQVRVAQLAAESGMEFVRYQLASISIPYNTPQNQLFAAVADDLKTQLNGSQTLSGQSIEIDGATAYIPARNQPAITLGDGTGSFRAQVTSQGTQLLVRTTGTDNSGNFARDIQLEYAIAMHASNIFDFGVASKGPISMNGNVSIRGTLGNEVFGSVLVVSDNNTVPLTMIGNSNISGDVSLTRTNPQSVSIGSSSTIAGFSSGNSQFWQHVHDEVKEPEFPVIETAIFKTYATNIIDVSGGSTPGGPVGGSGDAAGFVGLDYFNIQNNCTVKAYDSVNSTTVGSVTALGQTNAGGNLNNMTFSGEIQYKTSFSQNQANVTKLKKVNSTLSFAAPTTPSSGVINKGNYNGPSGMSETFPGGKYYFQTFSVPNGKTVIFSGPVELYVNGSCNISGTVRSFEDKAWNTKIRMVASAGVDLNGNTSSQPLYLDVYAPLSPLNINNHPKVYGSFIMKGINVSNSQVVVDRAIKANGGATATPTAPPPSGGGGGGTTTFSSSYYKNILIKANTNPKFTGNKTFDGVIYIEFPNKVEFSGNTTINGIVVVQTDGNNNIGLDPLQNTIYFNGNVTARPLSSLPSTSDFTLSLRNLSGGFVLAPGFGVTFSGNFGTVSGSIVASKLDFNGNAGGTVQGTVINLNNTPFTMSGNSDIIIQSAGTSGYPSGVYFGSRYDPLPDSYVEVTP
jgi:Tfp pilus assembly protein PilX